MTPGTLAWPPWRLAAVFRVFNRSPLLRKPGTSQERSTTPHSESQTLKQGEPAKGSWDWQSSEESTVTCSEVAGTDQKTEVLSCWCETLFQILKTHKKKKKKQFKPDRVTGPPVTPALLCTHGLRHLGKLVGDNLTKAEESKQGGGEINTRAIL